MENNKSVHSHAVKKSEVTWTEEQMTAITEHGKSILVSAAAGSGKTSVMVERILRMIIDGKADVDGILVLTFTNASAADMRDKLSKAIRNAIKEKPEESVRLKSQLDRLYRAYITTFDSFAVRIIREFFYMTDIDPNFRACDEIESSIMKNESIDELFESAYANDGLIEGGSFRKFLRLYTDAGREDSIKTEIINSYDKLRTMPDYFNWAYEKAECLSIEKNDFDNSNLKNWLIDEFAEIIIPVHKVAELFKGKLDFYGLDAIKEKFTPGEFAIIDEIYEDFCSNSIEIETFNRLSELKFERLVLTSKKIQIDENEKEKLKDLRNGYKKPLKEWVDYYIGTGIEEKLSELSKTREYVKYYIAILENFEKIYKSKKSKKKMLDFADMEQYAADILASEEVSAILRNRLKYIFIDEYQDTNNIQEALVERICTEDNVFKVGDIKQSIYRFRHAEPSIFEDTRKKYSQEDKQSTVIYLNKNHRTSGAIIKYVNSVFRRIMAGYDENQELKVGVFCPNEFDFTPEVHILIDGKDCSEEKENKEEENLSSQYDELAEELTKKEAEAKYIAKLAQSIIGRKFYDTKTKRARVATAKDIVILLRSVKSIGDYTAKELSKLGITSYIEATEDYFNALEIEVILSLLTCIDNPMRDVPLIATLHSEIFSFTPTELAKIRLYSDNKFSDMANESENHNKRRYSYYDAIKLYAESGDDEYIVAKTKSALGQLNEWRNLSEIMPLDDLIWKIMIDSGYYQIVGAMQGGMTRQSNLRLLIDRAKNFREESLISLSAFISFVEMMKKKKIKNGQNSLVSQEDDVVRILTIHKSKGLEYPFVIIGEAGKKIRYNNAAGISIDSKMGISLPFVDEDDRKERRTILQKLMKSSDERQDYDEALRVLYVAMTRARNGLYLVGTVNSTDDIVSDGDDIKTVFRRPRTFIEAMKQELNTPLNLNYTEFINKNITKDLYEKENSADDIRKRVENIDENKPKSKVGAEIIRRLEFAYSSTDEAPHNKYSVTEINRIEKEKFADNRQYVIKDRKKTDASYAEIGTAYHRIMEFIDFNMISGNETKDIKYIEQMALILSEKNAISKQAMEEVDIVKIYKFFTTTIGARAIDAAKNGSLLREKPFTMIHKINGDDSIVQGVVDCCFFEGDGYIVIDYKSGYVNPAADFSCEVARIKKEYEKQIELYSEAIEKGTGMPVKEAYIYMFQMGKAIKIV